MKTQLGEVDIKVPRDRNGSFEPKIIGKYSRNADGMEEKILALYACGMSQRDIAEQVQELYGVEISPELVITPVINDRKSYNLVTARKYLNSAVYLCLMCHRHNSYLYRRE